MVSPRHVVNGLRFAWTILTLWYERQIFVRSVGRCVWPNPGLNTPKAATVTHVLIVADPQIIDHRSYPDRAPVLTCITQLLVDLNLRRSWLSALRLRPDIVVFLGDMMDGGRYAMSNAEYEQYYARFQSIFSLDPHIPAYFIPGNHDTGKVTTLGKSNKFSSKAKRRYISHFGPLNSQVTISNHTFFFIDAPSLAEEAVFGPSPGGTTEFVKGYYTQLHERDPLLLFTHIPLWRSEGTSCGPNREHGTIRQGSGFGYQNTLGKPSSDLLLQTLQPSLIFSGDDHDYCEVSHSFTIAGQPRQAREVTVKSLSMVMNVRKPGFQLLSLVDPHLTQEISYSESLCLMPDQLGIYLSTYIPFLILSLLAIVIANAFHRRGHARSRRRDQWATNNSSLPRPTSAHKSSDPDVYSWTFILMGQRRRLMLNTKYFKQWLGRSNENRGFVAGVLYDIRDVAWFPLFIFFWLAWWTFR